MQLGRLQIIAITALLAACSNAGPTTTTIIASEGGTVTATSHQITIPPSSLPADTEITLDVANAADYPALAGDRSIVLSVEPEGTALSVPATVTIYGSQIGAAAGEAVTVFQLVDGGWGPREFSVDRETGDVGTTITYFAPIGVSISAVPEGGVIEGVLRWGTGDVVGMATVDLYQGTTLVQTTQTSADGLYSFSGLEAGTYDVRVNFECMIDQSVDVPAGMTVQLDLTLCG